MYDLAAMSLYHGNREVPFPHGSGETPLRHPAEHYEGRARAGKRTGHHDFKADKPRRRLTPEGKELAAYGLVFTQLATLPEHVILSKCHPLSPCHTASGAARALPLYHLSQGRYASRYYGSYFTIGRASRQIFVEDRATMNYLVVHTDSYCLGTGCLSEALSRRISSLSPWTFRGISASAICSGKTPCCRKNACCSSGTCAGPCRTRSPFGPNVQIICVYCLQQSPGFRAPGLVVYSAKKGIISIRLPY